MKRLLIITLCMTAVLSQWSSVAQAQNGSTGSGVSPSVTLAARNRGIVNYTAAINADGSVASCFECVPANTGRVATGQYVVDFFRDVRINGGYFRVVQVDTLGTGTVFGGVSCTTADRSGVITSVFVYCTSAGSGGQPVDTSFTMIVFR
jgi:hypothetical protein